MGSTAVSSATTLRPSDRLADEVLLGWLRDMLLIREFENRSGQAYQQAKIGGFLHLYTGQEPVAVGTVAAVQPDDPIVHAYRDHGHALARGMSPRACMAEMFGRLPGCAKGKGGSMHMFDKPHWFFGGHGIVGAQTPLGVGLAFAAKYELEVLGTALENPGVEPGQPARKKVALAFLGDGALNQGALHEAMNLAGLWSLPCIFVVENNLYSMGTRIDRGTTSPDALVRKGEAYAIRAETMDAFDVVEFYDAFKPLADWCRENQKPAFVDVRTYRYHGHSMSDPQKYRTKEEVDAFKAKDGIEALASLLMSPRPSASNGSSRSAKPKPRGCLTNERYEAMQNEVREVVREAIDFAENAPAPDPVKELYADVLLNPQPGMSPSGDYIHGAKNPLL